MSCKQNDVIADQAVEVVDQLIADKEISEDQRDTYLDQVYKSLLEEEETRIFNKFRD